MAIKSVYAKSARFDTARPLTDEELLNTAPSIFACAAHESRSTKFQAIPTISVINALRKEGFFPVAARQSNSRDENKRPFTKHVVRLRRFDNIEKYEVGDTILEILLKNANDGTSLYELLAAMFKTLCMNSLVVQTAEIDTVKVRHMGKEDIPQQVIEGTYRVLGESIKCLDAPRKWSQLMMNPEEKLLLARAAHMVRFNEEDELTAPIKPYQLLAPRRLADGGNDLWTTFNVVQEHCLRGGDRGYRPTNRATRTGVRHITTRPIKNIDQDIKLNKALWMIGEAFAAQKAA